MMRLFLGLPVPLEVAHLLVERTAQAPARLNRARLPLAEDLHLTLRFFGAVDESRVGDMQRALDTLHQPAFPLTLVGVDAFRSVGAIFAALAPSLELAALAEALNEALAWRGFARDLRPFHPHVTLARVRRAVPQAELARWSGVWERSSSWPISSCSSRLRTVEPRPKRKRRIRLLRPRTLSRAACGTTGCIRCRLPRQSARLVLGRSLRPDPTP